MKSECAYVQAQNIHSSKPERLLNNKKDIRDTNAKNVVNLSTRTLNKTELGVLERGLNFVLSSSSIPTDNIICCIEDGIQNLSDEDKEFIRQDFSVILRKSKPLRRNMSNEERTALKNLRNDKNLVILKVDKGGAIVLMNLSDYNRKMNEHLTLSGNYSKLNRNPIKKIIRQVKKAINSSNLDKRTKKLLTPNNEITPRIYGLPKIHEEDIPLRPIVNTIGSPTYELAP
jgi:PHD/YefM family antitoxin component YafN of YafNO toxin-antitoxin module